MFKKWEWKMFQRFFSRCARSLCVCLCICICVWLFNFAKRHFNNYIVQSRGQKNDDSGGIFFIAYYLYQLLFYTFEKEIHTKRPGVSSQCVTQPKSQPPIQMHQWSKQPLCRAHYTRMNVHIVCSIRSSTALHSCLIISNNNNEPTKPHMNLSSRCVWVRFSFVFWFFIHFCRSGAKFVFLRSSLEESSLVGKRIVR